MTDSQLLAIALAAAPTMITVLIGILINNARLGDMNNSVNARFDDMRRYIDMRFDQVDQRFNQVDRRFDEMKDVWRSELHRVEEVLDARLKHLEERA